MDKQPLRRRIVPVPTELAIIRSLLTIFRSHRLAVAASVVLGILSSFAEGVGVALFIPFIQMFTERTAAATEEGTPFLIQLLDRLFANVPQDLHLAVICLAILGAVFLKVVLYYFHGLLLLYLDWKIGHQIRSGLTNQLLSISFRYIEKKDSGDLLNTLSTESWNATDALSVVLDVMITACTLLVYLALLILISPRLTALAIGAMLAISLVVRFLTRHVRVLGQAVTKENAALAARMLETVEGNKVIRTFGRETYEQGRFEAVSTRLGLLNCRLGSVHGLVPSVYEFGGAVLLVFILFTSAQNPATLASSLVFLFALYRVQPKMAALDGARVNIRSRAASIDAVTSLLSSEDKPYLASGPIPFTGMTDEVRFDHASFKYNPGDHFAIKDFSLRFRAGSTTALVGPSGSGKSTLIKLLLRLYDLEEGEISVDGVPLKALDLASWREKIAVVSQDVFVFNASIRDNIAYGRLDATDEEIVTAAKQANAHEFIMELPQGYQTKVGDRGVRLSGGQLQRLTLARAIVRDPDILILDEATNSLDAIAEHLIQEALEVLASSRTVIIIAHRFSTIQQADHIIVLEQGRVREQGSLDSLLEQTGLFSQLYGLQGRPLRGSERAWVGEWPAASSSGLAVGHAPSPAGSQLAKPLISVVIPCYQQAGHLSRAIESVIGQTYEPHEIVVVDDGSPDATAEVANRYPDVVYIRQTHQGLAAARNAGLVAATGELLVFLDADDRLMPRALELGLECLRANPDCGFVFGGYKRVYADAKGQEHVYLPTFREDMYLAFLSRNWMGMHGAGLFRRDALLGVDKYDQALGAAEDYDLCLRLSRRFPAACHRHVVAEYRMHEGNMSRDSGLMLRESLRALRKQKPILDSDDQRAAFREGIRHWQDTYGGLEWDAIGRTLQSGEVGRALRAALGLLRHAPRVFVLQASRQYGRRLRDLVKTILPGLLGFWLG